MKRVHSGIQSISKYSGESDQIAELSHQRQIGSPIRHMDDVDVVDRSESFDVRSEAQVDADAAIHQSHADDLIRNHLARDKSRVLCSVHKLNGHVNECDAHSSLRLRETQSLRRSVMKSAAESF